MKNGFMDRKDFLKVATLGMFGGALMACEKTRNVYVVDVQKCDGCKDCYHVCGDDAIRIEADKAQILASKCEACGKCYQVCPESAIYIQ